MDICVIEEGPYCTLMHVQGYIEMERLLHNARESSSHSAGLVFSLYTEKVPSWKCSYYY